MKIRRLSPRLVRRGLTALAVLLALTGLGFASYPFVTDMWTARIQHGLRGEFTQAGSAERYKLGKIETGDPLTRIQIPRIGVDTLVVEGTTLAALRAGAGHYPETPLPGEPGNVAIAGHRTTYGKPFNRMDELGPGDKVILTTPIGRHVYQVISRPIVVDPYDWSAIHDYPKGGSFLTLTSCHPEGSAQYRIVVRAKLIESSNDVAQKGTSV
ncbi:MAG TPA: class E sortase [Actinomycetota bacterium]|jgi:sortase A|nr:class E sortase [Actinomycetota bacterium]